MLSNKGDKFMFNKYMIIMANNKAWSVMFLLQQRQLFSPPTKTTITVILFGVEIRLIALLKSSGLHSSKHVLIFLHKMRPIFVNFDQP